MGRLQIQDTKFTDQKDVSENHRSGNNRTFGYDMKMTDLNLKDLYIKHIKPIMVLDNYSFDIYLTKLKTNTQKQASSVLCRIVLYRIN